MRKFFSAGAAAALNMAGNFSQIYSTTIQQTSLCSKQKKPPKNLSHLKNENVYHQRPHVGWISASGVSRLGRVKFNIYCIYIYLIYTIFHNFFWNLWNAVSYYSNFFPIITETKDKNRKKKHTHTDKVVYFVK